MKWLILIVTQLVVSCGGSDVDTCKIACVEDAECPSGQTCGDLGRCTGGEPCAEGICTPGAFLSCNDDETARVCDDTGTVALTETCGGFGCNAVAARCNACPPEQIVCSGVNELVSCSADGTIETTDICALGCTETEAAHCVRIAPVWLPEVCDSDAPSASLELATDGELDTSDDATCNGGVVSQADGPEICVVRHGTIVVGANVKVKGTRALAMVADEEIRIDGSIDVSADGRENGPGGGTIISGTSPTGNLGGGGAGFKTIGAAGGGSSGQGTGGSGGMVHDPLAATSFGGGPRAPATASGGGGGALLLISCRDTVTVTGAIDAGGGGGAAGGDRDTTTGTDFFGGAGGGAGGYVVMEGAQVVVTGTISADGGGGGGGCTSAVVSGTLSPIAQSGRDGENVAVNVESGAGGDPCSSGGGIGGNGGVVGMIGILGPSFGTGSTVSAGGGGGSRGRFQVYTPAGVTPMLSPTVPSLTPEPSLVVETR